MCWSIFFAACVYSVLHVEASQDLLFSADEEILSLLQMRSSALSRLPPGLQEDVDLARAEDVVKRRPAERQLARAGRAGRAGNDRESAPRVIFTAGLEGAGHHFLMYLWEELRHKAGFDVQDLAMPTPWNCTLGCEWNREPGYSEMVKGFQGLHKGAVHLLDMGFAWSYPFGLSTHENRRDRFHPHMLWISEAASATATDFRVLFLYRPMEELLAADCVHRLFEPSCNLQAETLVNNADHLATQIDAVRARGHRVQCMEYGDLPQMIDTLESVLGIDLELGEAMRDIWHPAESHTEFPADWPEIVSSIRAADEKLLKRCKAGPRIAHSSNVLEILRYSLPAL